MDKSKLLPNIVLLLSYHFKSVNVKYIEEQFLKYIKNNSCKKIRPKLIKEKYGLEYKLAV